MAAAEYYNDSRYRAPPPQYEPRPSRRTEHLGMAGRMEPHEDSPIEEIQREFPPGEYAYGQRPKRRSRRTRDYDPAYPPRRARSANGRYGDASLYDDRRAPRSDRHRSDRHRPSKYDEPREPRRDRRSRRSYSSSPSPSPPPRRKPKRRKSLTEQAMGAMGALGLGNAVSGAHDSSHRRHRSDERGGRRRRRHDDSSSSSSPSRDGRVRGPGGMDQKMIAQAVKAALTAGAAEAYRARKEPGGWTGEKGKRIVTAALASGGADGVLDRDPSKHGKRHIIESALAGLATNRAVNGPRSRSRSRDGGRHGSKSHGGDAIKGIATSGALVAAGKEIYDHLRSRSKSRGRGNSSDDDDPRSRGHGSKKRSQSVSDYISKGLAAVGIKDEVDKHREPSKRHGRGQRERSSRYDDSYDSASDSYDSEADFRPRRRDHGGGGGDSREVGRFLQNPHVDQNPNTALSKYERGSGGRREPSYTSNSDSESDLGSSSGEEHTHKKMMRRQMITAGLATVATVHAAHGIVGSMKKRKVRLAAVRDGDLDPKEALRQRRKINMKDAATVGLAALGVKGAVGEWKEARDKGAERKQFREQARDRAVKRQHKRSKSVDTGAVQRRRASTHGPYD